jgi:hypothetical protein
MVSLSHYYSATTQGIRNCDPVIFRILVKPIKMQNIYLKVEALKAGARVAVHFTVGNQTYNRKDRKEREHGLLWCE